MNYTGRKPYLEFGPGSDRDDREAFEKTKNLEFDSNSKYLVCFGREKLNIISLEDPEAPIKKFAVDPDHFRAILDVQLVS